jgi:hypothetical protein
MTALFLLIIVQFGMAGGGSESTSPSTQAPSTNRSSSTQTPSTRVPTQRQVPESYEDWEDPEIYWDNQLAMAVLQSTVVSPSLSLFVEFSSYHNRSNWRQLNTGEYYYTQVEEDWVSIRDIVTVRGRDEVTSYSTLISSDDEEFVRQCVAYITYYYRSVDDDWAFYSQKNGGGSAISRIYCNEKEINRYDRSGDEYNTLYCGVILPQQHDNGWYLSLSDYLCKWKIS